MKFLTGTLVGMCMLVGLAACEHETAAEQQAEHDARVDTAQSVIKPTDMNRQQAADSRAEAQALDSDNSMSDQNEATNDDTTDK